MTTKYGDAKEIMKALNISWDKQFESSGGTLTGTAWFEVRLALLRYLKRIKQAEEILHGLSGSVSPSQRSEIVKAISLLAIPQT